MAMAMPLSIVAVVPYHASPPAAQFKALLARKGIHAGPNSTRADAQRISQ